MTKPLTTLIAEGLDATTNGKGFDATHEAAISEATGGKQ
jgi:hypothetical protein